MRLALQGAFAAQAQHRVLGAQGCELCHAQFGGFFHQPIHTLVGGHAQGDVGCAHRFAFLRLVRQHLDVHRVLAHVHHTGRVAAAQAVEQTQLVARLHAQHLHMAGGVIGQLKAGADWQVTSRVDAWESVAHTRPNA